MELRIEDELYARALGWEVLRYIRQNEDKVQTLEREIEHDALQVLEQIRCILDDNALDDPECFRRVERIVQTFYAYGLSTTRHSWE